jgi:hypothetical protein
VASQTRQAREADRKLSVQTLAVASISSALAAVIVSQFWKSGTAAAAAITPVVVTVISELLHKPARAITSRVTTDRAAVLPEGAGAGAPAQRTLETVTVPARDTEVNRPFSEERPPPLHDEDGETTPSDERPGREAPITYHRAGSNGSSAEPSGRSWRDRINFKIVAATAALAFVIGAAILTIPELVSGGSVGRASGGTTLFGGDRSSTQDDSQSGQDTQDSEQQQDQPAEQNSGDSQQPDQKNDSGSGDTQRQKTPQSEQTTPPKQQQLQQQQKAPATPQQPPAQP